MLPELNGYTSARVKNGPEPALRPQGQPTRLISTWLNSIAIHTQAGFPHRSPLSGAWERLGSLTAQAGWVAPNHA